jgi:hypothetical protein
VRIVIPSPRVHPFGPGNVDSQASLSFSGFDDKAASSPEVQSVAAVRQR